MGRLALPVAAGYRNEYATRLCLLQVLGACPALDELEASVSQRVVDAPLIEALENDKARSRLATATHFALPALRSERLAPVPLPVASAAR